MVCRAFKKRTTNGQTKTIERWDRNYLYDEQACGSVSSTVVDHNIDLMVRQQQPQRFSAAQNFLYKQEEIIEEGNNNLSFMHAEQQLVQLPHLESPSLPLAKKQSSVVSPISDNINNNEDDDNPQKGLSNTTKKVTTDWRALDKFVASQLSQEERHEIEGVSSFATHHTTTSSDMALLLLQNNSRENERNNKFNPFFNTSSTISGSDIGICVFEK